MENWPFILNIIAHYNAEIIILMRETWRIMKLCGVGVRVGGDSWVDGLSNWMPGWWWCSKHTASTLLCLWKFGPTSFKIKHYIVMFVSSFNCYYYCYYPLNSALCNWPFASDEWLAQICAAVKSSPFRTQHSPSLSPFPYIHTHRVYYTTISTSQNRVRSPP